MKKVFKILAVSVILTLLMTVASFAADVTFNLTEYDADASQYMVDVSYKAQGGYLNTLTVKFTFDTEKLKLANTSFEPITDVSTAGNAPIYFPSYTIGSGLSKKDYSYSVAGTSTWTVTGKKAQSYITGFSTEGNKFANDDGFVVYSILFVLADGVKKEDLTEDDFAIDYIYVSDTNLGKFALNEPTVSAPISYTNNVVPAKTAPDTLNDGVKNVTEGSGVRYKTTFAKTLKNTVSEYGFVVTTAANLTTAELNMALVSDGKAVKGVAYGTDKDIYWSADDTESLVTAVIVGVPMTKTDLQTKIAVRSYYILKDSGTVVYGKVVQNSVYEIAKSVKEAGGTAYESNKTYIDAVIAAVDGTQTTAEVQLDVDPLFSIEA